MNKRWLLLIAGFLTFFIHCNYNPTFYSLKPIPDIPAYEQDFEDLFSQSVIKTIHIHISLTEWNGLLNDYDQSSITAGGKGMSEICRKATFYYGDDVGTADRVDDVGFRIRGSWLSRERPEIGDGTHDINNPLRRVHFKIKFNEQFDLDESVYGAPSENIPTILSNQTRTFKTVRGLNLKFNDRDPSQINEVFANSAMRNLGVHSARATYTKFYIKIGDDPEQYFGVYNMLENIHKDWIIRRYGANSYLFKCLSLGLGSADLTTGDPDNNSNSGLIGMEITDPCDPRWTGTPYRPTYDLKTKDSEFLTAQDRLNELILFLQGSPSKAELENMIDIQAFLRSQAVNVFLANPDDYWYHGHNYYLLYRATDNKWLFIPYDLNLSFYPNFADDSFLNWGDNDLKPLIGKVLAHKEYQEDYKNYVRYLYQNSDSLLNWDNSKVSIETLNDIIKDHTTGYDVTDDYPYNFNIDTFKNYIETRIQTAIDEIH